MHNCVHCDSPNTYYSCTHNDIANKPNESWHYCNNCNNTFEAAWALESIGYVVESPEDRKFWSQFNE